MQINRAILSLALGIIVLPFDGRAECVPSDDPCAPKKVVDAWDTSVSLGLNVTSGNSETTLFNFGARALRETSGDIWDFTLAYNYGEDDNAKDESGDSTTRNDLRTTARYDYLLNERLYVGAGSTLLYDEIADIDYRVSADPVLGYYFLKDNSFKLRGEAGPSYIFERVGSEEDEYLAPRIAERFDWAITCTSKIFQLAELYVNVDDSEQYLINAEAGVESALSTQLALVFTVRNRYDNQPAADSERNDLQLITALKIAI